MHLVISDINIWSLNVKGELRKEVLTPLGTGLTVDGDGVMGEAINTNFGKKRRFRKLVVRDKKGVEAEWRERKGEGGATVSPRIPISIRGTFYDDYTSSHIFC